MVEEPHGRYGQLKVSTVCTDQISVLSVSKNSGTLPGDAVGKEKSG